MPELAKRTASQQEALRTAFASWATDHAGASVLRAHSSWSRFFDFLVAEDLVEATPWRRWASLGVSPARPAPSGIPTPPVAC